MKPCCYLSLACLTCLLHGCAYTIAPPQPTRPTPGNYERWMKDLVRKYPVALSRNERLSDWWPLEDDRRYKCTITDSASDSGRDWVNKEFTLILIEDKQQPNTFHFDAEGFSEFPYESLSVRDNRIFVARSGTEHPLLAFPLFKDMIFSTEAYEHEFLKRSVLSTSEESFFAPVWTGFHRVQQIAPDTYRVEQLQPRQGSWYKFKKGVGITEWFTPGGYTIELSPSQSTP